MGQWTQAAAYYDQPALSLATFPKTRAADPQTSRDAAARAAHGRRSWRAQIVEALVHPMTDNELCVWLNVDPVRWPSIKTARSALFGEGKVRFTGVERDGQKVWQTREALVRAREGVQ